MLTRRVLALCIDWLMSMAVSAGFFDNKPLATLAIFFVMRFVLTFTLGTSFGKRICGLIVRNDHDRTPGIGAALIRTLALCLVFPAAITTSDGRGMHEVWSHTHQRLIKQG